MFSSAPGHVVRMLAIARKELRHIYRDPQILFMAVIAPAFILFLLAYVFAVDADVLRIGLMDLDRSPTSRQVIRALTANGKLVIARECRNYDEVATLLRRGQALGVLVIPPGFGESVVAGRPEPLQAALDGSDYISYNATYADLAARTMDLGTSLLAHNASQTVSPLAVQVRNLYNPTSKWLYAMVPGLMAAAFCFPAIAVALALTRETERGSYEGLLSTPMGMVEYLLGKLLPYLAAGLVAALLTWGLAVVWFRVPFRGSLGNYLGLTLIFLLALMSMSILIGTTASAQRHAIILIVVLFFIPTFFMSGLLVPLDPEQPVARVLKMVLPAANYVVSVRAVFLKGLSLSAVSGEIFGLLRITAVALGASYILARRKVA